MSNINSRLAFYVTDDNELEVKFDALKISNYKTHYIISIINIQRDISSILLNNGNYYISDGKYLIIDFIFKEMTVLSETQTLIKVPKNTYVSMYKNNFYSDLVYSWKQNDSKYHWTNLSKSRLKTWLYACARIERFKRTFTSKYIYINFQNIDSEIKLLCYLGQVFFGDKGYCGNSIYALKDCFLDIKNINETEISIVNYYKTKKEQPAISELLTDLIDAFKYYDLDYRIFS